ncbi:unnamed protein product [Calicophoron daubneyi]|uniref:RAE1/2 domain-containing protein n=1 Tax=Calicophoron daubneyi TaxID=300641 RepID=A0AAV2TST3_CALDB
MDFPEEVDCIIYGTGLAESMISASLSVLGRSVLHVDKNNYYGGKLASLRFPDLMEVLERNPQHQNPSDAACSPVQQSGILSLNLPLAASLTFGSSHWYLSPEEDGIPPSNPCPLFGAPSSSVVLTETANNCDTSQPDANTTVDPQLAEITDTPETVSSTSSPPPHPPVVFEWNRARLEERMRRVDLDFLPKIIYAESPTVTALLRSDVTRYLEFRFISRILAFTTPPASTKTAVSTTEAATPPRSTVSENAEKPNSVLHSEDSKACLIQIPVCRSEVFKTRLLTLCQKRSLGSFFEWCFHLPAAQDQSDQPNYTEYFESLDRPFRDFLMEQNRLDEFTQHLVMTNLALGGEDITTKEAVRRIRQLLLSMGRFGLYPLLWPLYGCGDLPQGYCRMSAVFGGIFCLGCPVESIRRPETQLGDINSQPGSRAQNGSVDFQRPQHQRNFVTRLADGHEVRSSCVVVSADLAPPQWVWPHVKRWSARGILITDRSLYPEGIKPTDVSMLALPLSRRGSSGLDPALLLEIPVEQTRRSDEKLFIVHLSAVTIQSLDAEELFRPIVDRLFIPHQPSADRGPSSEPTESFDRPHLLWAGYFCLPDFSSEEIIDSGTGRFTNSDGLFICPGPDSSFVLDSTSAAAESIFRSLAPHLNLSIPSHPPSGGPGPEGGSDGPHVSGLSTNTERPDLRRSTDSTVPYLSLEARWDGVFPPRPPRQEELVIPGENENDQEMIDQQPQSAAVTGDT